MRHTIGTPSGTVTVGSRIRIASMRADTSPSRAFPGGVDHQAEALAGATGTVTCIDDLGQLHGTWGGLAVIPGEERFEVLPPEPENAEYLACLVERTARGDTFPCIFRGFTPKDVLEQVLKEIDTVRSEHGLDLICDTAAILEEITSGSDSTGPLRITPKDSPEEILLSTRVIPLGNTVTIPVYIAVREDRVDAITDVGVKACASHEEARLDIEAGRRQAEGCQLRDGYLEDEATLEPDHIDIYDDDSNGYQGTVYAQEIEIQTSRLLFHESS